MCQTVNELQKLTETVQPLTFLSILTVFVLVRLCEAGAIVRAQEYLRGSDWGRNYDASNRWPEDCIKICNQFEKMNKKYNKKKKMPIIFVELSSAQEAFI